MTTADEPMQSDGPDWAKQRLSEHAVEKLLEKVEVLQLDYVRFTFADLHGIARCKSVPRRHVEHFVRTGGVSAFAGQLLSVCLSLSLSRPNRRKNV